MVTFILKMLKSVCTIQPIKLYRNMMIISCHVYNCAIMGMIFYVFLMLLYPKIMMRLYDVHSFNLSLQFTISHLKIHFYQTSNCLIFLYVPCSTPYLTIFTVSQLKTKRKTKIYNGRSYHVLCYENLHSRFRRKKIIFETPGERCHHLKHFM